MVHDVRAVTRFRFRSNLGHRLGQYATVVCLVGLVGGISMGALEAARTTQSSYPAYLLKTNASSLTLSVYGIASNGATNYSPSTAAAIAHVPGVKRVESWVGIYAVPLEANGAPNFTLDNDVNFAASNTGLYFDEDRVTAVEGRVADPNRVDEFMTTSLGARLMGFHLGQTVPIGLYGPDQASQPGFGTAAVPPERRFTMKLVGIVQFNNEVVQDDADRFPTNVLYTPAFARQTPLGDTQGTWYGIQLTPHAGPLSSVEQRLLRVLPAGSVGNFSVTAVTEAKVERAVKPEAIALAVFGLIAALAGIGVALPVISRSVQSAENDRRVLWALGASRMATLADTVVGLLIAIVVGALAACAVSVALSPLAPFGPIHAVYHPGVVFDWTVLAAGGAFFVVGLSIGTAAFAILGAPGRLARQANRSTRRTSQVAQYAASAGLPMPAVAGLRFALEPGTGRTAVPARSVVVGAIVAIITVTATLTFGNSLRVLVTHPALYGWNWDAALMSQSGVPPNALDALSHDREVQAWSGYGDLDLQVDGQTVPALTTSSKPAVGPPILLGQVAAGHRVVLGPATLALLHKRVGDTVSISFGSPNTAPFYLPPTPAVIGGTATFPAVAGSSTFAEHPSLGTGILVTKTALPPGFGATQSPDPVQNGPSLVFVRMRPGLSIAAGQKDMERVVGIADRQFNSDPNAAGDSVMMLPVQRPAEIVNYQSTGGTPEILAGALGAGAALALAVVLAGTARRRRTDLAVLKTLGFTSRQLASTLIWQATSAVLCGVVVGIPLGLIVGRQLWDVFDRNIDVVPHPATPLSVALVALGALLLAVVVAAIPGRMAARTPAAVALRQE